MWMRSAMKGVLATFTRSVPVNAKPLSVKKAR
jgi:hypothetical protein